MPRLRSVPSILCFFYLQRLKGFAPASEPHLDAEAGEFFGKALRRAHFYLEFGSGGSTLTADRLGVEGISVESDRYFAKAVRRELGPESRMEILHVGIGITREWSMPLFLSPSHARLRRWRQYSAAPFQKLKEAKRFPDFVLIDGRFRRACALETARQAIETGKPVTVMFDDYFTPGREHYQAVEAWLGEPERHGRAAIFPMMTGSLRRAPTEQDIDEANADYR